MHVVFIPYGIKQAVDHLLMDMQSQKFKLKMSSPDGKQEAIVWMQGSLRVLPFGVYEYVFPKESLDAVLTTLDFDKKSNYEGTYGKKYKIVLGMIRKALNVKDTPKFENKESLLWIKNDVAIMPIGVRYDDDIIEPSGDYKGWKHEAL